MCDLQCMLRLYTRQFSRSSGISSFYSHSLLDPNKTNNFSPPTGDAWPAVLLRLKSFDDLHRLWFIGLKEKNLLMSERQVYRSYNVRSPWPNHGRLKKTKLTMKRILTVLTRRAIDQQCVEARDMLAKQKRREVLEYDKVRLDREGEELEAKLRGFVKAINVPKLLQKATITAINKNKKRRETVEKELVILRAQVTKMTKPVWQMQAKYSDLPGNLRWTPLWVRALEERRRSLVKKA
jgi:large subunit ribosomal protein L47